jgi:hypothetical protein
VCIGLHESFDFWKSVQLMSVMPALPGALPTQPLVLCYCTGWQLLAQNVEQTKDDAASSSTKQQHDQQSGKSRPQRSSSGSSDMSEDSGTGHVAQALVQPRPHQWLYKEYKIQDEIGSGGFGRVCRWDPHSSQDACRKGVGYILGSGHTLIVHSSRRACQQQCLGGGARWHISMRTCRSLCDASRWWKQQRYWHACSAMLL